MAIRKGYRKYEHLLGDVLFDEEDEYLRECVNVARSRGLFQVRINQGAKSCLVHRLIMEDIIDRKLEKYEKVIQVNFDVFDNRRHNLKIVDRNKDLKRRKGIANTSSKYKGVRFKNKKWTAEIKVGDEVIHLGYFNNETDAALLYDTMSLLYFGENAWLNFPEETNINIK